MATALAVYSSDGCEGRCDAKCHDAMTPASTCECICGGRLHGVGRDRALARNTDWLLGLEPSPAELSELRQRELVRVFAEAHGLDAAELELRFPTPTLF